jgi:hypothetical protein
MQGMKDCCNCHWFTSDTTGSGLGLGHCKPYEDFKNKGVSEQALTSAFNRLGGQLFWGGPGARSDRECEKYKARTSGETVSGL